MSDTRLWILTFRRGAAQRHYAQGAGCKSEAEAVAACRRKGPLQRALSDAWSHVATYRRRTFEDDRARVSYERARMA